MARLQKPKTNSGEMGRSRLSSPSKDIITDDGTALLSIVDGEQIQIQITIGWMTSLTGSVVVAKIVEGNNDGEGTVPTTTATTPSVYNLSVLDADTADNIIRIVIPEDLVALWSVKPSPNKPSYGFLGLEIGDGGVGIEKQVWKPLRGLVEVVYSPSEA